MNDSRIKKHDWLMTLTIFMLMLIGLVVIYSTTLTAESTLEGAGTINRQLVFVILGFIIYFLISNIDPTYYRYLPIQIVIFIVIVSLLLYVWLLGDPIRNTNRWIEWGFIRIQPSEYSKNVLIVLNSGILANLLRKNGNQDLDWKQDWRKVALKEKILNFISKFTSLYPVFCTYVVAVLLSVLCIVLILVEPALGNASIVTLICLSLFLISYPKQKDLLGIIAVLLLSVNVFGNLINLNFIYEKVGFSLIIENFDIAVVFLSIIVVLVLTHLLRLKITSVILTILISIVFVLSTSYIWNNVLKDYQRRRIEIFFNPEEDPQGAGWQLRQAKIAIGSGRLFGKGFLQGSQSKLRYLPEAYSDFIFAAFCEEFGLLGAGFLFCLYIFLVIRIIKVAKSANNAYESLICFGVASMILIHVFINTGMNMGILPITGIPLPLISYGGSSIMVTMIALGLVQAVNMNRDIIDMQESLVVTSRVQIEAY